MDNKFTFNIIIFFGQLWWSSSLIIRPKYQCWPYDKTSGQVGFGVHTGLYDDRCLTCLYAAEAVVVYFSALQRAPGSYPYPSRRHTGTLTPEAAELSLHQTRHRNSSIVPQKSSWARVRLGYILELSTMTLDLQNYGQSKNVNFSCDDTMALSLTVTKTVIA